MVFSSPQTFFFIVVLSTTIFSGVTGGLIGGFRGSKIIKKDVPNQGIWNSIRNALILSVTFSTTFGLLGLLTTRALGSAFMAVVSGLIAMLIGGGSACIRHFSLRLLLYRLGYAPWNYARILDYATERLFLQKVGGGYIFIHRMLLEHFAQMKLEPVGKKKRRV